MLDDGDMDSPRWSPRGSVSYPTAVPERTARRYWDSCSFRLVSCAAAMFLVAFEIWSYHDNASVVSSSLFAAFNSGSSTNKKAAAAQNSDSSRASSPIGKASIASLDELPHHVAATGDTDDNGHFVCRKIREGTGNGLSDLPRRLIPSADALWSDQLPRILDASKFYTPDGDTDFLLSDFTAQLLHVVSPRLHRGVHAQPRDWSAVRRVLDVLEARWRYLQDDNDDDNNENRTAATTPPPPPLRIVVFGGSVTQGGHCQELFDGLHAEPKMYPYHCRWSTQLQQLIDNLLGFPSLVKVINLSQGGTTTDFASTFMLKYGLMPKKAMDPDIVINAYSTNDMGRFSSDRKGLLEELQVFVRYWLSPSQPRVSSSALCRDYQINDTAPPLLIFLDDFLGNRPRELLPLMEFGHTLGMLANYYGFGSVSYTNVVRDLVYGDTAEFWFTSVNWWGTENTNVMGSEIHPSLGMHMATSWAFAYYFLQVALNFCTLHQSWSLLSEETYSASKMAQWAPQQSSRFNPVVPGKPRAPPRGMPPLLDSKLSIEDMSALWKNGTSDGEGSTVPRDCFGKETITMTDQPCIFGWVGGVKHLKDDLLQNAVKEWSGWKIVSDNRKPGISPSSPKDVLSLEFLNVGQPVRKVVLAHMKSYGPRWEGSEVSVLIKTRRGTAADQSWESIASRGVTGYHGSTTSEMYIEEIELPLPGISIGESLRVEIEFRGSDGMTFKILGILVCSS